MGVLLLWVGSRGHAESHLVQFSPADFYNKLEAGKIMLVFFQRQACPTVSLFLAELEKSAVVLQDYGILVGKLSCNEQPVTRYCTEERLRHRAFLFRSGKEFLSFDLDTLFDVNSIVSEVLFAILREEVKYVHTDTDLMIMEKGAKGKKDIVLGYVLSLGTQEHRSFMETAYAYGSKYQFILITGGPVLKYLGAESLERSRVWFLHCRLHGSSKTPLNSERCPLTTMPKPLTTLNLHSFLQLMESPLVTEVYDDPSSVQPPPVPYQQTPQVFLFSRPATAHLDRDTAASLAWKLRGLALTLLVHRESPSVKIPEKYNAGYRLPAKSSDVKYVTLHDLNEVLELLERLEDEEVVVEDEEGASEDNEFERFIHVHELDDEVAAALFEKRTTLLDKESVGQLTSDNFHDAVAQSSLTVALFYLQWDAVSMTVLESFIDVAKRLADSEVQMSVVDCGEWTHLCAARPVNSVPVPFQPISSFPTILLLRPQGPAQPYGGLLDAEALHRFITLSQRPAPALLSSQEEVSSFLQEVPQPGLRGYKPHRSLGLFHTQAQASVSLFSEAARSLRGELLTGLLTDDLAQKWAALHAVQLPAVLVFPSWRTHGHPSALPVPSSAPQLVADVSAALLHPMPELTVENLPSFLSLGKALLMLFVGEEEDAAGFSQNQALLREMKTVVELGRSSMDQYLASWVHLGRTPAAMSVLGSYLGSMPPLPALVLTHLPSGDEVYQFPPNAPIVAPSVLQWLQRVEAGIEKPAGMLGSDSWPAPTEFLDFLKIMDAEEEELVDEEKEKEKAKEEVMEEDEAHSSSSEHIPEKKATVHSEL